MTSLSDVLPAAAASLGVAVRPVGLTLPPAARVVVLLVDGMGEQLLRSHGGHAPFMRSMTPFSLSSGYPSTTATSLGMFGTGLMPGAHGLVGLDVLDPDRDVVFNELQWDAAVDPRKWQPSPTVFEEVAAAGLSVVRIGPGFFDGSGLTEAVQRGGRFRAASTLAARVETALDAVRSMRSGLVYVYWGDLDKTGHEKGVDSWAWIEELERIDAFVRDLAAGLPSDSLLLVTADHGMVDVPFADRLDLAFEPALLEGVRHVAGEPRAVQLHCRPGAVDDVVAAWRARLGDSMTVVTRAEAVAAGWFGPVSSHVLPRIGDIVTSANTGVAVMNSLTARPEVLRLVGLHGARTPAETEIPLLATPAP